MDEGYPHQLLCDLLKDWAFSPAYYGFLWFVWATFIPSAWMIIFLGSHLWICPDLLPFMVNEITNFLNTSLTPHEPWQIVMAAVCGTLVLEFLIAIGMDVWSWRPEQLRIWWARRGDKKELIRYLRIQEQIEQQDRAFWVNCSAKFFGKRPRGIPAKKTPVEKMALMVDIFRNEMLTPHGKTRSKQSVTYKSLGAPVGHRKLQASAEHVANNLPCCRLKSHLRPQLMKDISDRMQRLFKFDRTHGRMNLCTSFDEAVLRTVMEYRDFFQAAQNVMHPNIVLASTAHPAFYKAAEYLNVPVRTCEEASDPDYSARRVLYETVFDVMDAQTILIIVSYPQPQFGCADGILDLANRLKNRRSRFYTGAGLHVDCNSASLYAPLLHLESGHLTYPCDLSVPGITSMTVNLGSTGHFPQGVSAYMFYDDTYKSIHDIDETQDYVKMAEFRHMDPRRLVAWSGGPWYGTFFDDTLPMFLVCCVWATLQQLSTTMLQQDLNGLRKSATDFLAGCVRDEVFEDRVLESFRYPEFYQACFGFCEAHYNTNNITTQRLHGLMRDRGWNCIRMVSKPSSCPSKREWYRPTTWSHWILPKKIQYCSCHPPHLYIEFKNDTRDTPELHELLLDLAEASQRAIDPSDSMAIDPEKKPWQPLPMYGDATRLLDARFLHYSATAFLNILQDNHFHYAVLASQLES
eukprot:m.275348 g.275348  ORF g.275348 m.275348 type:complete len:689 (+) comp15695_c0_seq3:225-2291(+)